MKVAWSDRALRSLAAIHEHISGDSPEAANSVVNSILRRGDQLAAFPFSGRAVGRYNKPAICELIESPYRIVYRVRRDEIQVIDVFHTAQLPLWER